MTPNPYLPHIIRIAQHDLPGLQYDIQNASTIFTQQECLKRLHNIVTYLCHHIIQDAFSPERVSPAVMQQAHNARTAAGTAPAVAPVAHPAMVPFALPLLHSQADAASAPQAPQGSLVTEVMITPQGTTVMAPGSNQPVAVLPADAHGIAPQPFVQPAPAPTPGAPGQAAEIVLPAGGGMTPEVAAALGVASGGNAGAARNITHELPPG